MRTFFIQDDDEALELNDGRYVVTEISSKGAHNYFGEFVCVSDAKSAIYAVDKNATTILSSNEDFGARC